MIHQRKKGFTLIELIIAITILAILAVGLIAALDPVEQINKSRDSVRRDQVIQIAEALERYYALHENYLVGLTADPPVINGQNNEGTSVGAAVGEAKLMVDGLASLGELKANFQTVNAANMDKTWIYRKNATSGLQVPVVCTEINSKSFTSQVNLWTMVGNAARTITTTTLGTYRPENGVIDSKNCTIASSGVRDYCAFCIDLQP